MKDIGINQVCYGVESQGQYQVDNISEGSLEASYSDFLANIRALS